MENVYVTAQSENELNRFADIGTHNARWILVAFLGFAGVSLYISLSPYRMTFSDREAQPSDLVLYWAEVERISDGQGYYEAAAIELTDRGYPTHSVFNWRTPLPMWILGKLPSPHVGSWILASLGIMMLLSGVVGMRQETTFGEAALLGVFLTGAVIPCLMPKLCVSPLLWSGVLLGLSLMAFHFRIGWLSVVFGIAAIFFREFVGLYIVIMSASAWRRRQYAELSGWVVGVIAYGIFFLFHAVQVANHVGERDVSDVSSWLNLYGLPAVIGMTQMNGFLLMLPQWVSAIYLSLAVLGFAGWRSRLGTHMGLIVFAYLLVFSVIGKDVNQFWGSLFAPLLCFGAARAPQTLLELMRAAR